MVPGLKCHWHNWPS